MSKLIPIRNNELSSLSTLSNDRKFGTDGIRGPVTSTMNPLFVTKLGWAAGSVLKEEGLSKVFIGKDTRISGYMLESALQAGFISAGMDVTLLGPLPTPGVSYLAKSNNQIGLVISASHNLFEDNGIKFFNKDGHKFSAELEKRIENKLTQEMSAVESINLGKANRMNDAQGRYIEFCKSSFTNLDLSNLSILLDCANGATYSVAPSVFRELGAKVDTVAASPDGININQNCGSTSPNNLKEEISEDLFESSDNQELACFYLISVDKSIFDIDQIFGFLSNYGAKIKNKYFSMVDENGIEKFRIINALNPGTFENDTKSFAIVVVSDLSMIEDPLITVKKMIEFSINFSEKFHATLCDEERTPITKQMISHIESKAQDIERINQLNRAEN